MEGGCYQTDDYAKAYGIEADLVACFYTDGGKCPFAFPKIEGRVCNPVWGKPRACCLIQPAIDVEVKFYAPFDDGRGGIRGKLRRENIWLDHGPVAMIDSQFFFQMGEE